MEKDVTNSRHGMDIDMETCRTASTAPTATTPKPESSGVAASATSDATPDHSSRRNDETQGDKWICYECKDGLCERCVGVPCQCDCPDPHTAARRADEAHKLYRIRKDRANRFMVSAVDVDFLLEVIERLSQ